MVVIPQSIVGSGSSAGGLGALTSATMVHALLFTYFMGTGRWIEETSQAYSLPIEWYRQNQRIKYGILPGILMSFLMLVMTGSLGAVADPATRCLAGEDIGLQRFNIALHCGDLHLDCEHDCEYDSVFRHRRKFGNRRRSAG